MKKHVLLNSILFNYSYEFVDPFSLDSIRDVPLSDILVIKILGFTMPLK